MEALERRHVVGLLVIALYSLCTVEGQRNNTKMSYVCPPQFIRLGHSCYFFSEDSTSWSKALFACKDKESNLSVPARWEDRNLRKYLNKHDVTKKSRWIGGVYDYPSRAWKWGGELRQMHYQSFSKMKKMTPEDLNFHCITMMPELWYRTRNKTGTQEPTQVFRWAPRNCFEERPYICQTKLQKLPKPKVKELRRRWQRMGKLNEITAPTISREVNDAMLNDVTVNPLGNPKSYDLRPNPRLPKRGRANPIRNPKNYDLRPNELRKRLRPMARSRLTRPFPGYTWNRRDPEGSYNRNAELLRSGRLHLSAQQIKAHLARLQHLRDKQIARRKRIQERDDWLVNEPKPALAPTHARTYTVDNNISALHPKTIVEEFDMFPPPPPVVSRPARGAG